MSRPFRFGAQLAWPADPHDWGETARRVEESGYSVLTMPDHLGDQLSPFPALGAAASATTSLRLGTLVAGNDLRHPALLARDVATLDLVSRGRAEVGLGAGWMRSEYDGLGLPFDPAPVRIDRLGEAITILKGLLAGGRFTFSGLHYQVDRDGSPRPQQWPRPPILVGGGGRRILTLAGREADAVSVNYDLRAGELRPDVAAQGTLAHTRERLRWVSEGIAERTDGVQPELSVTVSVTLVTGDRRSAASGLGAVVGLGAEDVLASPHFAVGTPAEIGDDLCRRRDELGISYFVLGGNGWEALAPVVERLSGT